MSKVAKSLSEKTTDEILHGAETISYVSWERLKEHLEAAVALKVDERILGIIADENGVQVKIARDF